MKDLYTIIYGIKSKIIAEFFRISITDGCNKEIYIEGFAPLGVIYFKHTVAFTEKELSSESPERIIELFTIEFNRAYEDAQKDNS